MSVDLSDRIDVHGDSHRAAKFHACIFSFFNGNGHNFLETTVDNIFISSSSEEFLVFNFKGLKLETGDVGNNEKEIEFGFFFPLASKSSGSHVVEILKPFEVADSDTTSVNEDIREEYNSLLSEDLLSGDGSRSISSF